MKYIVFVNKYCVWCSVRYSLSFGKICFNGIQFCVSLLDKVLLKFHKFSTALMKANPVLLTCLTNVTFVRLLTAACCEADVTFGIYGS